MLSAIQFVDKELADRSVQEEKKARKKEKKREKKEKKKLQRLQRKAGKQQGGNPGHESASVSDSDDAVEQREDEAPPRPDQDTNIGPATAAAAGDAADGVAREDWMSKAMPRAKADAPQLDSAAEEAPEQPKQAKELNVYWKDGGDGVPDKPATVPSKSGIIPTAKVGDGGASWRLKALKRAQAAAAEEGRSVNEIVSERFSSLKDLTASLTEQRAAPSMAHAHAARERRGDAPRRERQPGEPGERDGRGEPKEKRDGRGGAHYLEDVRTSASQMRRPVEGSSLSWRRAKAPDRAFGRQNGDGRDDDHQSTSGRDGPEQQRGNGRRDQPRQRNGNDRGVWDAPGGRSGAHRRGGPLGRPADADVLRGAAVALNEFSNDGSFLDHFKRASDTAAPDPAAEENDADQAATGLRSDQLAKLEAEPDVGDGSSEEVMGGAGHVVDRAEHDHVGGVSQTGALAGNFAAAAALRARLKGDPSEPSGGGNLGAAAALKARLLGQGAPAAAAGSGAGSKREVVTLPQVDASGRAVPGAFGRERAGEGLIDGGRKPKRLQRYDAPGEKARYFADDDAADLGALIKRQRYEGAEDIDANLAENIAHKARYKGNELDVDEEYDHDGGLSMYESRNKKGTREKQVQRQKAAQVADYRRASNALDACAYCFSSKRRLRHLTVAIGQTACLMLPPKGRLVPGHCLITPLDHVPSTRQADENVWTEIRNFKKCLLQMFMAQGQDVIFMETAKRLGDARSHGFVECIPVPPKVAAKAPLYFKKGIDDAESEWAQHHAKRWIDTSAKGLRGCIPPNFPYFAVEMGLSSGHVHVIDDEEAFPDGFGRGVLIGLLQLPPEDMHRSAKQESVSVQEKWVADFADQWDPYDWTKQLG